MTQQSTLPKFIQISEMLIREIAAGHLSNGAKLPPERDMAADLGISVGTLRKSLDDLQSKGLLERVHGSGNYVRAKADVGSVYAFFRLEKTQGGGLPTADVLSVDRLPKPADAPPFGPADQAHRIRRLRRLDGMIVALEEIWLDGSYKNKLTLQDLSDSLYLFYRKTLKLVIAAVEDRVGCAPVPDWSPQAFALSPGTMAGYVARVSRTSDGVPAEFSRTWFDSGKAHYIARMGRG